MKPKGSLKEAGNNVLEGDLLKDVLNKDVLPNNIVVSEDELKRVSVVSFFNDNISKSVPTELTTIVNSMNSYLPTLQQFNVNKELKRHFSNNSNLLSDEDKSLITRYLSNTASLDDWKSNIKKEVLPILERINNENK